MKVPGLALQIDQPIIEQRDTRGLGILVSYVAVYLEKILCVVRVASTCKRKDPDLTPGEYFAA